MPDKTTSINLCREADENECPHALPFSPLCAETLANTVLKTGWPSFLLKATKGKPHRHHKFQISVSACPNGCSRPHIADFALVRACEPTIDPALCSGCGLCIESCPDQAMAEGADCPSIDPKLCLRCGHCAKVCPEEAIRCASQGWRVFVGGRLGRHPKLATELPGLYSGVEALRILEQALHLYMHNYTRGKRFGQVLEKTGLKPLSEES